MSKDDAGFRHTVQDWDVWIASGHPASRVIARD